MFHLNTFFSCLFISFILKSIIVYRICYCTQYLSHITTGLDEIRDVVNEAIKHCYLTDKFTKYKCSSVIFFINYKIMPSITDRSSVHERIKDLQVKFLPIFK